MKILIVDDDESLCAELVKLLEQNGYEVEVLDDLGEILERVKQVKPDLILLDINLPQLSGENLLREIRRELAMPVIMVTGQDTEADELLSMSYGADDFVTKPYNPNILLLRIEAVLRRAAGAGVGKRQIKFHEFIYDPEKGELEGTVLTKNERLIFNYLLENKERIVKRRELMTLLWDNASYLNDATLSVTISRLRDKMEKLGLTGVIETRKGQGYILA